LKVLNDYKKKRSEDLLHRDLEEGSPAKLREACVREYGSRSIGKDEKLLREFFEHTGDLGDLQNVIKGFDINKLKPLSKFMRGETGSPKDKIVELLAWLIDFKDRPYDYKKDYSEKVIGKGTETPLPTGETPAQTNGTGGEDAGNDAQDKPGAESDDHQSVGSTIQSVPAEGQETRLPGKRIITIVLIFVAAGFLLYWLHKNRATGHEACMYWADDHYELVSCRKQMENAIVIGLDSEKLVHFRRITRPDTITGLSIGSIWYTRYKGEIEYYTSNGFHPIDFQLRLKPLTLYVLRKYIWKQNVPGEDDSAHISSR
jgi:hypothetical protein